MYKLFTTRTHGMLDYLTAATLAILPRAMGWSPTATRVFDAAAVGVLGYSMLTRYEYGVAPVLPMKGHLIMDAVGGTGLIVTGVMLSGEGWDVRGTLIGFGVWELIAPALTETEPRPDIWRERELVHDAVWPVAQGEAPLVTERMNLDEVKLGDQI